VAIGAIAIAPIAAASQWRRRTRFIFEPIDIGHLFVTLPANRCAIGTSLCTDR
jgi:hypothetical protein